MVDPATEEWSKPCSYCAGSGKAHHDGTGTCDYCRGKGYLRWSEYHVRFCSGLFRRWLFNHQDGRCGYCRRKMVPPWEPEEYAEQTDRQFTLDHKLPVSRGGLNTIDNLIGACVRCNNRKANMTYEEFTGGGAKSQATLADLWPKDKTA